MPSTEGLREREPRLPKELGIDDKHVGKSHPYLTVLYDLEQGTVVDVLETRKDGPLRSYFLQFPAEQIAQVQAVAVDMWEPYTRVVCSTIPNRFYKLVYDRFHIMKHANGAVDQVRAEENRELRAKGDQRLASTQTLFRYAQENLPQRYQERFEALKQAELKTGKAYALRRVCVRCGPVPTRRPANSTCLCGYSGPIAAVWLRLGIWHGSSLRTHRESSTTLVTASPARPAKDSTTPSPPLARAPSATATSGISVPPCYSTSAASTSTQSCPLPTRLGDEPKHWRLTLSQDKCTRPPRWIEMPNYTQSNVDSATLLTIIHHALEELLKTKPFARDLYRQFVVLGLNSIRGVELAARLSSKLDRHISPLLLAATPHPVALAASLAGNSVTFAAEAGFLPPIFRLATRIPPNPSPLSDLPAVCPGREQLRDSGTF